MKRVILPMTAFTAVALSVSSFANTTSTAALSAQINALSQQTKQLQHQVWLLKQQQKKQAAQKPAKKYKVSAAAATTPVTAGRAPEIVKLWRNYVTVTTAPYLSRHAAYNGSDLLYNVSSVNEDLLLLQQKSKMIKEMDQAGIPFHRPMIQFSGSLQGQAYSSGAFTTNSANGGATSGIALSTAELDMNATASRWATAFMALTFSGSPVSTGNRNPNSQIYLERGFLTLGDLNKAPVYFSMGEMYAPFGAYTTSMVSTPETQSLFEIRTPVALLGYTKGVFNGSIYDYEGSQTSSGAKLLQQGGVNAGIMDNIGTNGKDSFKAGAGYVTNIADSQGMQGTGYSTVNNQFSGFGASTSVSSDNNTLVHAVGGVDGNAALVVGRFTLLGEYIFATRAFSPLDLTYDGSGAQPTAGHAEVDYVLPFFPQKYGTALGISFDQTSQALGLNLEQNKYAVYVNTNLWRETVESIEYNYQKDYGTSNTSIGRGATTPIVGTGRGINTVIGEVGVYF